MRIRISIGMFLLVLGGVSCQTETSSKDVQIDSNNGSIPKATSEASRPFTPDGFRGFEWGANLEDMESSLGLFFIGKDEAVSHIDNYGSNISVLGSAKVDECVFGFFGNRLCNVSAKTANCLDAKNLLRSATVVYGPPDDDPRTNVDLPTMQTRMWMHEKTIRTFSKFLKEKKGCEGAFFMLSKSLYGEIENYTKNRTKDAKSDF